MLDDPRHLLRAMFDAAIGAASPRLRIPAHLPPPPKGRTVVIGAGKGLGRYGPGCRRPLARSTDRTRRHALRPCRSLRADRDRRSLAPRSDENGHRAAAPHAGHGARAGTRRPSAGADLGRRLVTAEPARSGPDLGGQAGRQRRPAPLRRADRRDEYRAQAPVRHQGRPARGRRLSSPRRDLGDLRRARRRPGRHRLRSHGPGQLDLRRSARRAGKVRDHRTAARRSST